MANNEIPATRLRKKVTLVLGLLSASLLLGLAGCSSKSVKHATVAINPVRPGTYALRLCRVVCDAAHPANVIQAGLLVLDTAPIRLDRFPGSSRRLLNEMVLLTGDTSAPNGCYVLESRRSVPTLAGGWGGGLLHWQRVPATDSISFSLFQTADAGHEDRVRFAGMGFIGTGHSSGSDLPEDLVVGDYLGTPDQRRCSEAVLAYAATTSKLRREFAKAH